MERMPFLVSPEVKNALSTEQRELQEAQKTEQLVYKYKIKREEMLSIFDEVREYLSYEDVVSAQDALQGKEGGLLEESRENFMGHIEGDGEVGKHILYEDFQKLLQENPYLMRKALNKSIRENEAKKVGELHAGEDKQDEKKIQQEIEARTLGKMVKVRLMLKRYSPLQSELAEMTEDDLNRIAAYEKAYLGKTRSILSEIQKMKKGISSAKSSKNIDVVRKEEEVARIHGLSVEEVKEMNSEIEDDFFELFGKKISLSIEAKYDEMGNIVNRDFLTAYVNYNREMKDLYGLLNRGKIVETGYVKEIIERALPVLKKNPPSVVYFHGDQGTGKTALAVHLSRTRFSKEPIIVAGSKYLDPDRFTEEFKIQKLAPADFLNQMRKQLNMTEISKDASIDQVITELVGTKEQISQAIVDNIKRESYDYECAKTGKQPNEQEFERYRNSGAEQISAEKMEDIEREIDEVFSNSVQGRYMMGAMYQAMMEGRPLIIDEANAISPDVLIAFNDLMTRKIGESISTRTDEKKIKIKDGYCVIWTGNTGERFKQARFQDIDPAALSRIVPIKFEYLPQSREVNNMDQLLGRLELDKLSDMAFSSEEEAFKYMKDSKKQAQADQIFQVMLVKLLNKRLGTELLVKENDRYSVFKDIYKLSVGARLIMDLFEGKVDNDKFPKFPNLDKLIGSNDATVLMKKLKKSNLTLRELMDNIIGGYLDEGCSMDIEYYLFKFVQKYDAHSDEQAILYAILQKAGFFGTDDKWPDYQTCRDLKEFEGRIKFDPISSVDKYKKIEKNGEYVSLLNTEGQYTLEYFNSFETLQLLFGYLPPRKKEDYEAISQKQKELAGAEEIDASKRELLESIKEIKDALTIDLFPTAEDARNLLGKIRQFKISEPEFLKNSSDEEFFAEVDGFHNVMLEFLHGTGKISDEDLERAQGMSPTEKSEFIKGVLGKKD